MVNEAIACMHVRRWVEEPEQPTETPLHSKWELFAVICLHRYPVPKRQPHQMIILMEINDTFPPLWNRCLFNIIKQGVCPKVSLLARFFWTHVQTQLVAFFQKSRRKHLIATGRPLKILLPSHRSPLFKPLPVAVNGTRWMPRGQPQWTRDSFLTPGRLKEQWWS